LGAVRLAVAICLELDAHDSLAGLDKAVRALGGHIHADSRFPFRTILQQPQPSEDTIR
jgi:hypothetical protein